MRSILAVGDITEIISDEEAEIAVLEEPEHLTWYHHGKRWKSKFCLVVGVVHTNYLEYVRREKNGRIQAFLLKYINSWVVNIYCHKVIRLSAATQNLPRSIICNVNGVNPKFLEIGLRKKEQQEQQLGGKDFTKGTYYIGKMVWNKGYKELLKLLRSHHKELKVLEIDLYGSGEDSDQVWEAAQKLDLKVQVHPGRDHADPVFHNYKVFLNPSTTDVVCTTTAEALAMGKIVVCANHPSNEFFKQFRNCQMYEDGSGFVEITCKSLAEDPAPLSDAERHELSWEAATERFLRAAELDTALANKLPETPKLFMSTSFSLPRSLEDASALMHYMGTGLVSSQPDEEQRKELGLATPSTQKGRFEILSLSGSFKPTDTGGAKSITGGMSVSFAGPDGRVMGGGLAGLLVAAGPVQVVIGSFIPVYQQEQKPKKQRSELAPTISPIPAVNHIYAGSTDAIYTGTMRSITPASYHGNGSAGNFVNGQTIVAPENNILLPREGHTVVAAENNISLPGDGQNIVAAENNISKPGESEKLSPSKCMVSC